MEPNDLNSPANDDRPLEAWLRTHAALPPLADDGFSNRVLAALPAPAAPQRFSRRRLACLAGALAGAIVASRPWWAAGNPVAHLPALDAALTATAEALSSPAMGLGLATTLASLVFVFWRDLRRIVRAGGLPLDRS